MNAPVLVDRRSAESVVSAARLFAQGDQLLVYIYTAILLHGRQCDDMVSLEDLAPCVLHSDTSRVGSANNANNTNSGVWWHVPDGKNGYEDYYLGFAKPGDGVLLTKKYHREYEFHDRMPHFDPYVWGRLMENERDFEAYLRGEGREPSPWADKSAGERDDGRRWYIGTLWSKPVPVQSGLIKSVDEWARIYTGNP